MAFEMVEWRRDVAVATGFEVVAGASDYSSGVVAGGKIYLGGPGGIAVVSRVGDEPKRLVAGVDLPGAAVVSLAVGRLRGESEMVVVAGTRGEGVVLVGMDGRVRVLRAKDTAARDVTAVLPMAGGDLLVGTRGRGLMVFDGTALREFSAEMAKEQVTALAGEEDGGVWVGTRAHGVVHLHAGEVERFGVSEGMPDAAVTSIAVGEAGLFVGTPLGVASFKGGRFERVVAAGMFAQALAVEGERLVVATVDEGVHEVELAERRAVRGPPVSAGMNVMGMFAVGGELLAVGDGGLWRRGSGGAWDRVLRGEAAGLAARHVTALHFGEDGRLWVGYFDRGLDVLDLQSGRAEHVEDDHVFCVNRIVADPLRQTVDVATANGLVLFDPRKSTPREAQVLARRDGLISDQVTDVAFARDGMTLATPAGLTFFTAGGATSLYAFQGLVNNHVYALAAERGSGRLLAGTLGGISVLDDERVMTNLTLKNSGLKRNWITAIVRVDGADGASWFVGTYGGGVVKMDAAGRVVGMDGVDTRAVINPTAMLVTERHLLAGTLEGGLMVYDRGTSRWSSVTSGLPSRDVTALAERGGEIYVGTENGLVRIAEARLP